jgi:hypothetical protein
MKTEISKFCEECLQHLGGLPRALEKATTDLEAGSEEQLIEKPLRLLNDIRARLRSLMEKLASQQAYLLIFGPLKSGKSTLMNAISGAYVSEVTSLPGYPCLVFVRNAPEPHFSVTRYNGRETIFANGTALKDVIEDSHLALAEQIRATELRGDDFDPRTHFTEAIRRIDVKLPVHNLAESSTVLVDTPGLYSRMNFGYDVLTREFRDSAACAVFVVKTDNLFLEQVFAEFNQLLGLFSRIFLVINVDSSKRDLHADGSLQPSAESRDPEKIIDAFKTLSMAGPLRRAYEEKRVRIHAIDLLSAASSFLSGKEDDHSNGAAHQGNGQSNGNHHVEPSAPDWNQKQAFEAFVRDLTDYLNSSDYTVEFIRDSLRQGAALCTEAREIVASEEMEALRARQTAIEAELGEIDHRVEVVDRLLAVDWKTAFEKVTAENASRAKENVTAKTARVALDMREELDRWFGTAESLQALERDRWNPLLDDAARALSDDTHSRLAALLGPPLGGAEPAALVMNDLHAIGFPLAPIAEAAASELQMDDATAPYLMSIRIDDVPVRKTFADWLLFRKAANVRRRFFGEERAQEVAPELKAKRLRDATRAAFEKIINETVETRFPTLPQKFAQTLLERYVTRFIEELLSGLRDKRKALLEERACLQEPFEANRRLLLSQEELHQTASLVNAALLGLAVQENALLPAAMLEEAIEAVSGNLESEEPPASDEANSLLASEEPLRAQALSPASLHEDQAGKEE